jgi:hypothetical protein
MIGEGWIHFRRRLENGRPEPFTKPINLYLSRDLEEGSRGANRANAKHLVDNLT